MKWFTRIFALLLLLFGLPFYFGYGNPLPFINPEYTLWDNVWLTVFPVMFIGLAVGWFNEKLAGYIIVVPLASAFIAGFIATGKIVTHMFVPMIVGILYLFLGYRK